MTIIKNAKVVDRGTIDSHRIVAFEHGVLVTPPKSPSSEDLVIDAEGLYLSAGFVDIHTHGGGGADFLDATTEAFSVAANIHAKHGTTTLLPTATSSSYEEALAMFQSYEEARVSTPFGADMPGLHLEGPYFSPAQCGAQDPEQLRTPKPEEYIALLDACPRILRWSTAPELDGSAEFASELKARGVLPSIGHSDAEFDQALAAFDLGFTHVTHLYSCTSTVHRKNAIRQAGVVECAYLTDGMTVEIIADGIHLPAALLKMIYRFIGPDRIALVTDSMRGAGMPEGPSVLGSLKNGLPVIVENGVAKLADRSALAGSVATMDRLLKNMVQLAGASLPDAVKMASETPAKIMGLQDRGILETGKRADLVLFDENFQVVKTIVAGKTVFSA